MDVKKQRQSISAAVTRDPQIRVLEIIGNASIGGMENYMQNFLGHLNKDQFSVTCICPYESSFTTSLRQLGVKDVFITPIADDPRWRSIQLVIEIARLHEIDVLHAHMPKAHVLAGIAGSLIKKPVVATIHGMDVTSHELGITRAVGSHIITNCQESYTQALAMGISPNRLSLIHNGVDTTIFTPGNTNKELLNSLNLPEGTPLVGFVGRLEHEKGPDLFLMAVEYVHYRYPDVHFVIAGEGSMRGELEKICKQRRLDQHVHFVGWNTNCADLYRGLNILVHTSRSDGTSLVLLEAMSCGCPCVGIGVGGIREIIEHEHTALLAGQGDWEEVGIRIIELLEEPERAVTMGMAARAYVQQNFNVEKNTHCTAELLKKISYVGINGHQFSNNHTLSQKIS